MCTVTYIPKRGNDFILTSNRDESPLRAANRLVQEEMFGQQITFPRDLAGGTWVAVSNANRIVCILNGAFEKHERRPPYRRSRGLMALDYFSFSQAERFFRQYTFANMEPFTMIIADPGHLFELRWDGSLPHVKELSTEDTHIWSSATLYPADIRKKRKKWFEQWLANGPEFTRENILHLHRTGGDGDPHNDYVMNRHNIVRTVSITSIEKTNGKISMEFIDLVNDKERDFKEMELELELEKG